jgi:hypothetical protein
MFDTIDAAPLDREAERILRLNDRGGYTVPTEGFIPTSGTGTAPLPGWASRPSTSDRAWTSWRRCSPGQWENGMVPHILFHRADPGYFPGPEVWGTEEALGRGGAGFRPRGSASRRSPPSLAWRIYEADREAGRGAARGAVPEARGLLSLGHGGARRKRGGRDQPSLGGGARQRTGLGRGDGRDRSGGRGALHAARHGPCGPADAADEGGLRPLHLAGAVRAGRRWDEAAIAAESPFRVADPTMTFTTLRSAATCGARRSCWGRHGRDRRLDRPAGGGGGPALEPGDRDLRRAEPAHGEFRGIGVERVLSCAGGRGWRIAARWRRSTGSWSAARFGIPSQALSADLRPLRYWRGPVWAIMNYMAGRMAEQGLAEAAAACAPTPRG